MRSMGEDIDHTLVRSITTTQQGHWEGVRDVTKVLKWSYRVIVT